MKEERRGDVEKLLTSFQITFVSKEHLDIINSPANYVDCLIDIANIASALSSESVYNLRD